MIGLRYHGYGAPDVVRLETFDPGKPGKGQILVEVKAASVNPMDWKIRSGSMRILTGNRFPRTMGTDFAGIVIAIGSGVTRLKIGDAVLGTTTMKAGGAFAEQVTADEMHCVVKPANVSFEHAASLPIAGCTAWTALVDKAHLRPGQSLFVHGALGGVGRAAVQIAHMLGGVVSGSCSALAVEEARSLGMSQVLDYKQMNVKELEKKFDIVFDTPGMLSLKDGGRMLKHGGVLVNINPSMSKMLGMLFSSWQKMVFRRHCDGSAEIGYGCCCCRENRSIDRENRFA